MEISEIYYATGTIFFIIFTITAVFVGLELVKVLRAVHGATERANDIVENVKQVSTGMQFGLWALATKLIGGVRGGGGK